LVVAGASQQKREAAPFPLVDWLLHCARGEDMPKRIVGGILVAQHGRSIGQLVGDRLRARRTDLGLAIENVAEALGVETSSYECYEEGGDQTPALLLAEIAEIFGVPVLWFFEDVIAQVQQKTRPCTVSGWPPVYRVATLEERIQFLADWFRKLDFEG